MPKILALFLICVLGAFAAMPVVEKPSAKNGFKLLTGEFVSENNQTIAKGGVTLFGDGVFIYSSKATFRKDDNRLELFGNVLIKRDGKTQALVDYLIFDVDSEQSLFDGVFVPSWDNDVWLVAANGKSREKIYTFKSVISSSCEPNEPDWSITATTGIYNTKSKFVHMINPVFYAGRVPVLYLPYFGYSTDNTRRTGFLPPTFGKSNKEGALYELPFYIAPQDNWDIEIWGQERTKRGRGVGGVLRFVDSPQSRGSVYYGFFRDKPDYQRLYGLKNSFHSGLSLDYTRDKIFSSGDNADKIFIKWEDYNDVDYLKLKNVDSSEGSLDQIIINKINYYYATKSYYFGLGGRYSKDIKAPQRKDILQNYPNVRLHSFLDAALANKLLYSADLEYKNFSRKEGTQAQLQKLSVPLTLTQDVLNEYLNITFTQRLNFVNIDYKDTPDSVKETNGKLFDTFSKISASTILLKPFGNHMHIIDLGVNYTLPTQKEKRGILINDFYELKEKEKEVALKFSQHVNTKSANIFSQRLSQNYKKDKDIWNFSDLQNEFIYNPFSFLSLSSETKYSIRNDVLISNYVAAEFKQSNKRLSIGYLLGKDEQTRQITSDYYKINATYQINAKNKLDGEFHYDALSKDVRKVGVTYAFLKKCWNFIVEYSRELEPTSGAASRLNDIILLKVNLNPLGEYKYRAYER
ncbi:MAG: LPS-assembly protein LptD [Helicobacteraceae bacterium]